MARPGDESQRVMVLRAGRRRRAAVQQVAPAADDQGRLTAGRGRAHDDQRLDAYVGTYQGAIEQHRRDDSGRARAGRQADVRRRRAGAERRSFSSVGRHVHRRRSGRSARSARPRPIASSRAAWISTWRAPATRGSRSPRRGRAVKRPPRLAIMNGRELAAPPRAGERLRIVVGG